MSQKSLTSVQHNSHDSSRTIADTGLCLRVDCAQYCCKPGKQGCCNSFIRWLRKTMPCFHYLASDLERLEIEGEELYQAEFDKNHNIYGDRWPGADAERKRAFGEQYKHVFQVRPHNLSVNSFTKLFAGVEIFKVAVLLVDRLGEGPPLGIAAIALGLLVSTILPIVVILVLVLGLASILKKPAWESLAISIESLNQLVLARSGEFAIAIFAVSLSELVALILVTIRTIGEPARYYNYILASAPTWLVLGFQSEIYSAYVLSCLPLTALLDSTYIEDSDPIAVSPACSSDGQLHSITPSVWTIFVLHIILLFLTTFRILLDPPPIWRIVGLGAVILPFLFTVALVILERFLLKNVYCAQSLGWIAVFLFPACLVSPMLVVLYTVQKRQEIIQAILQEYYMKTIEIGDLTVFIEVHPLDHESLKDGTYRKEFTIQFAV